MTHTQVTKRALEAAGFVYLRGGWVKREAVPRLQDKIDSAVKDAAEQVQAVKESTK